MILVDKMFGQIICYFLYLFKSASQSLEFTGPKKQTKGKKRFLIIKFWGMGSILLAIRAIQNLRENFPDSEISILTLEQNKSFCKLLKPIDQIITFSPGPHYFFIYNFLKLIRELRGKRFDYLIDLEFGVNFSAIISFFVKADEKIGFDAVKYWRGKLYTKKIPFDHGRHIRDIFGKMMSCVNSYNNFKNIRSDFTAIFNLDSKEESIFLKSIQEKYRIFPDSFLVILNINASDLNQNRKWPFEYYVNLTNGLSLGKRNKIVLIGSSEDKKYVKKFVSRFNADKVIDLAGELELEELVYLIKNSKIFIGNDSGPLHIAYTFDKPTVSFFGPETPLLYGPPKEDKHTVLYKDIYCSPCLNIYNSKTFICHDNQCLKQIRPEEVIKTLKEKFPYLYENS